ncbi:MAG: cupin domain-containing protein [Acholeplasmataceae bacterium]
MTNPIIKNIEPREIIHFKDEVVYQKDQVVSKTIVKSSKANISLFAFDKDEGLSAHTSTGDALVTILDGEALITIDDKEYLLKENESILMPANIKHALHAIKPFKMFLVIIFEDKK